MSMADASKAIAARFLEPHARIFRSNSPESPTEPQFYALAAVFTRSQRPWLDRFRSWTDARVGRIDRSHSRRLTHVTLKRYFGALKTQALVLLRLTSSSTRQTSQKKFNRRPVTPT